MKAKVLQVIFLIFLIIPLSAYSRTIRIGANIHTDEKTGRISGYEYEYFQELAKYTGWNYEFVPGDMNQYIQLLNSGYLDLIPQGNLLLEDEDLLKTENSIMDFIYYIFKHSADSTISSADFSTLKDKSIGVVKSGFSNDFLIRFKQENSLEFNITTFETISDLKSEFYKDKSSIDAICLPDYFAYDLENVHSVATIGYHQINYVAKKNNYPLIRDLNIAQKKMDNEKPYLGRHLKEKYYDFRNPVLDYDRKRTSWIRGHTVISIGYAAKWYPFCSVDKNGNVTGILPIYVNKLLEVLNLQDLKVNYIPFDSYDEAIEALKSASVNMIFPIYGDYFEADKHGIQKTNDITHLSLCLMYQGHKTFDSIDTLYNRTEFGIYDNYINQHLSDYKHISSNFLFSENLKKILSEESSAIIMNVYTADNFISQVSKKNIYKIDLPDSCPLAFGVRRDDIGLLSLLDVGIDLINPSFVVTTLNNLIHDDRKYTIIDYIKDNVFVFYLVTTIIACFVIWALAQNIITMKKTRKKLEKSKKEVDEALQIAEVANLAKSNFLNNMSHDIRTPMNAIIGFTKLAMEAVGNDEKTIDYLNKIQISSNHLLKLINDVLDMSRIESGKLILVENDENLISIVQDMKTILEADINKKKINFTVDTSGIVHPEVICDKLRINQILLNLLSNAVKFTPENGEVALQIKENGVLNNQKAVYQIVVKDNGIGISEEFQNHLFGAFERENSSTISKTQGTGLGLSITKKLVEMMGGTIFVQSKKTEGTEFTVNMQFTIRPNQTVIENQTAFVEVSADEIRKYSKGKKLLVVEDNELNQEIAKTILQELGFIVEIASNGRIAVDLVRNNPSYSFNAIFMDIQMPEMDGYEATRIIRQLEDKTKSNIPIIAMTANAFDEDRKNSKNIGMDEHLSKPIDLIKLMEILLKLFRT